MVKVWTAFFTEDDLSPLANGTVTTYPASVSRPWCWERAGRPSSLSCLRIVCAYTGSMWLAITSSEVLVVRWIILRMVADWCTSFQQVWYITRRWGQFSVLPRSWKRLLRWTIAEIYMWKWLVLSLQCQSNIYYIISVCFIVVGQTVSAYRSGCLTSVQFTSND